MAVSKKMLTIDVNRDVEGIITAKQGDANSRFLDVKLIDGSLPVNLNKHTVRFSALKPDGYRVFNNCEITDAANGRFMVELTNQTLAKKGEVEAEFSLHSDNETRILTTKTFPITVLESLFDEDAVASTNEFGAAVILFQDVAAVRETIYNIRDRLEDLKNQIGIFGDDTLLSWMEKLYEFMGILHNETIKISAPQIVKSVQRGTILVPYVEGNDPTANNYVTISISAVTPAKCVLFIDPTVGVRSFAANLITLDATVYSGRAATYIWQLVEYY